MLLTADDFAAGALQLAAAWQAHLPGEPPWQWVPSQAPFAASTGGGYLAMQHTVLAPQLPPAGAAAERAAADEATNSSGIESIGDEDEEEEDAANARLSCSAAGSSMTAQHLSAAPAAAEAAAAPAGAATLSLACHIAYHPSYLVPVLYLEAAGREGAPLGLSALLAALPHLRAAVECGEPYTVLTQEEHPFLRRPWFMLHPCQTAAVMGLLTEPDSTAAAAAAAATPAAATTTPAAAAAADVAAAGAATTAAAASSAALAAVQPAPAGAAEAPAAAAQPAAVAALSGSQADNPGPLRYLLAWLSVVGQPLGIRVPPDLWKHCC